MENGLENKLIKTYINSSPFICSGMVVQSVSVVPLMTLYYI